MVNMAAVRNKDIHKDLRLSGRILKLTMPKFDALSIFWRKAKEEKQLIGKWKGRNTTAEMKYIQRPDGSKLRMLVCRSKAGTKPNSTGLLWIHGGGYALGEPEEGSFFVDPMIKDGGTVAVMPAYTLSTKAPYPAALEDCYLALKWMLQHADELGINKSQLFVAGESAGGGLTAALCLYARDMGEVNIAFQAPLYPMIDDRMTESSTDNNAPVWDTPSNIIGWNQYLKGWDRDNLPIYAAPARAKDLRGLPPVFTYIGTIEPFYDETVDYVNRLKEQEVEVRFREFEGCFHAFDLMAPRAKISKEALQFLLDNFRYAREHYFAEN